MKDLIAIVRYSLIGLVFGILSLTAAAQDDATPLISWHPDGLMLAVTNLEGVTILDADTLETLNEIPGTVEGMVPEFLVRAEWSPDGTKIALFNDKHIEIWQSPWSPAEGSLVTPIASSWFQHIAWSPDNRKIAYTDIEWLYIADAETGVVLEEFHSGCCRLHQAIWFDQHNIAIGGSDRLTLIINATTGEIETSYFMEYIRIVENTAIAFTPDKTRLAMGDTEGEIQIRNDLQRAGEYIWFDYRTDMWFSIPEYNYVIRDGSFKAASRINSLDWSFDGRYLASASSDGTVRIWNPDTGENLTTITVAPGAWIGSAAWRPNSLELAYGNLDGSVTILVPDNVVPAPDALSTSTTPED